MKFKAELRNASGVSKTFEAPFQLGSHLTRCAVEFPKESDPERGLPIHIDIGNRNGRANLSSVVLHWKSADAAAFQEIELVGPGDAATEYHGELFTRDIIGDDAWAAEENHYKEYLFYVTASCDDGTDYVSPTVSHQVVRLDYTPNPVPEGGWTNISQCNVKWEDTVSGLDFSKGDYIEVDMDLSNCEYVYITGTEAGDMGKDNIIGFSTSDLGSINNSFIWYYPSVQNLVRPPADPGDWNSRIKGLLTSASTIKVGSKEGVHLSRATYNYVRVVRYKADAVTPVPRP